jgi:hypothetical protein
MAAGVRGLDRLLRQPRIAPFAAAGDLVLIQVMLIGAGHVLAGEIAAAALMLLLIFAGQTDQWAGRPLVVRAARAVALAALLPVLAAGLPLGDGSFAAATVVLAVLIAGIWLTAAPLVGVQRAIAFKVVNPAFQARIAAAGLMLGLVAYLAGAPRAWGSHAAPVAVGAGVVAVVGGAVSAELLFRCLVQVPLQRVARRAGLVAATALSTAVYVGSYPPSLVVVMAIAASMFGYAVDRTGTAVGAIAGHVGLAVGAGVLGPLILGTLSFPAWRGPEATVALVLWLGVVAIWVLRRNTNRAIERHSAVLSGWRDV